VTKSKRIASGLYEVLAGERIFHVEDEYQARGDDSGYRNQWNLFELIERGNGEEREYWQTFSSKRSAIQALQENIGA